LFIVAAAMRLPGAYDSEANNATIGVDELLSMTDRITIQL
jgi:hypothetical protein